MSARLFILNLLLSNLVAGICTGQLFDTNALKNLRRDPAEQKMIDSWAKGMETNGLACAVTPYRANTPTHLLVYLIGNTTNLIWGGLRLPPEKLFSIELFDAQGQPVEKTGVGKTFGQPVTTQYLNDWYKIHVNRRGGGLFEVDGLSIAQIQDLSLPQAFHLHEAGEYTLHLRMRLIQYRMDASGKPYFPADNWLPEVVTKVQIRPEDIPAGNVLPNSQTDSPTK